MPAGCSVPKGQTSSSGRYRTAGGLSRVSGDFLPDTSTMVAHLAKSAAAAYRQRGRFVPAAYCLGRVACRCVPSSRALEHRAADRDAARGGHAVVLAPKELTAVLHGTIHAK